MFLITDESKKYIAIKVKDNGIGFDPEYADKIFIIFQRLHGKDSFDGTGIGLAICKKIVEKYDGAIFAESSNQNGANFHHCTA
jgi:light-regulated signal transduction histidine kinase (bacteriophytochrome)